MAYENIEALRSPYAPRLVDILGVDEESASRAPPAALSPLASRQWREEKADNASLS